MQGKDLSPDVSDDDFAFDKFLAWYDEKNDIEQFKREIEKDFDFIVRGDGFCEMTVKGFSKGTGIEKVLEYHNIPIDNAYAIGDRMICLCLRQCLTVSLWVMAVKNLKSRHLL